MHSDSTKSGGGKIAVSSAEGLANVLAGGAAFFATPPLYSRSIGWVQGYTANHYGYGWEDLIAFAWFCAIASGVFFLSRGTIGTALIAGVTALVIRFLV